MSEIDIYGCICFLRARPSGPRSYFPLTDGIKVRTPLCGRRGSREARRTRKEGNLIQLIGSYYRSSGSALSQLSRTNCLLNTMNSSRSKRQRCHPAPPLPAAPVALIRRNKHTRDACISFASFRSLDLDSPARNRNLSPTAAPPRARNLAQQCK